MSRIMSKEVRAIIQDAGGKIVGRTRLQKIAYLLTATGLDDNFGFSYKHYGPFSEQVASSARLGALFGDLKEEPHQTAWGATYSIYTIDDDSEVDAPSARHAIAARAAEADSIELELAATAVFLAHEGYPDPWAETAQRKPEKATQTRINNARSLLSELARVDVPKPFPEAVFN